MRNGIEVRQGGKSRIFRALGSHHVQFLKGDAWVPSVNGPWITLPHAREDADRPCCNPHPGCQKIPPP